MQLATLRVPHGTSAAVQVDSGYALLGAPDVSTLLASSEGLQRAQDAQARGEVHVAEHEADFAALVVSPVKVVCCGLNYADHILEMGRELPEYPTLFAKFADSFCGAQDDIHNGTSQKVDWEAELAVVVGRQLSQVSIEEATAGIAGYTVANDISMRDWQNRTLQWFQGKAFDASSPIGPVLVTADEFAADPTFEVKGFVNDELVQDGHTSTLVFSPASLLQYVAQFTTLRPGDVVLTGTPGGVGAGQDPPRFLQHGDILRTEIPGLGVLENRYDSNVLSAETPANFRMKH